MAKPKRATGQVTVRCGVQIHEDLLQIAALLGTDLNALMNEIIRTALPEFWQRAKKVNERLLAARLTGADMAIPTEELLLKQVILEARKRPDELRMPVLFDAARRYSSPADPPVEDTVGAALEIMDVAEALFRLKGATNDQWRRYLSVEQQQQLAAIERRLSEALQHVLRERKEMLKRSQAGEDQHEEP